MSERSFRDERFHWRFLASMSVIGCVLALGLSFLTPLQYSSTVGILITQVNATGLDPYTAVKSTERIADTISQLMYTTTFFNDVLTQAPGFDASYFPSDEYDRRKLWQKTIEANVSAGTGIMTVSAYHPNREAARALVSAAAKEIVLQTPNYFGSTVRAQVIDSPLDSRWIARPEFLKNGFYGLLFGFFVGVLWLLVKQVRWR